MKIFAYHVSSEWGVQTLKPSICDKSRDDLLYGASVVCATTTTKYGNLPKYSVYPRSAQPNTDVHRYILKFDPNDYFKFLMAKTTLDGVTQVHFLMLQRDSGREEQVATFLKEQTLSRYETKKETLDNIFVVLRSAKEVPVTMEGSKRAWKRYFPKAQPNEYQSDRSKGGSAYVNVMFWHEVQVQYGDKVKEWGYKFPPSEGQVGMHPWLQKLFRHSREETKRYRLQTHEAEVRMLQIGRKELALERGILEMEKRDFGKERDALDEEKITLKEKERELKKAKRALEKLKKRFEEDKKKFKEAKLVKLVKKKLEVENKESEVVEMSGKKKRAAGKNSKKQMKASRDLEEPEKESETQDPDESAMEDTRTGLMGLEKKEHRVTSTEKEADAARTPVEA